MVTKIRREQFDKALASEAFQSGGNCVLTIIPSILLPFILTLEFLPQKTGRPQVVLLSCCLYSHTLPDYSLQSPTHTSANRLVTLAGNCYFVLSMDIELFRWLCFRKSGVQRRIITSFVALVRTQEVNQKHECPDGCRTMFLEATASQKLQKGWLWS